MHVTLPGQQQPTPMAMDGTTGSLILTGDPANPPRSGTAVIEAGIRPARGAAPVVLDRLSVPCTITADLVGFLVTSRPTSENGLLSLRVGGV